MSIRHQVLGKPGRDNALFARLDTGQNSYRFLFDCGEGTVRTLPKAEVQEIDHVFLSHFHMDHIAGFDGFFRANYNRPGKPVEVWGPGETGTLMHHRFRSFWWNLHRDQPGVWRVHDVFPDRVESSEFRTGEAFAERHHLPPIEHGGTVLDAPGFQVEARLLPHHGVSLGCLLREKPRLNIDPDRLSSSGVKPGPWLADLKEGTLDPAAAIEGRTVAQWREELLVETAGESLAYLTDFGWEEGIEERLGSWLEGVDVLVCESQYLSEDRELARRNDHLTAELADRLARRAGAGRLELFHLSDRYERKDWRRMLEEAREVFPETHFPAGWSIG